MNDAGQHALSHRRRLLVLGICCMSLLIVGLDTTIVNVALPSIRASFHASVSGLQWTIDAYTLVLASLLMLAGSTADRVGRRRTFQTGLVVFSLASLLCGLAPTLELLVAARVLQAIGGAMLNPVAMSIVRNVFEDPRERAAAIGLWGGVFGLSMALGPVLGGVLVDSVGWRSVFFVNVPIGLVAIALTAMFVPESRAPRPRRIDPLGQVLVIAALSTLTYAIIEGPRTGWGSTEIVSLFVFALGSLLCGLAPSLPLLIAARVVQAVGGSMLNPVAMSIVRNVFDDPRERAAAIGVWGGVFGLSMALGPVVGGALVDSVGWRSVFFVNVPIGLAAIALTATFVPESRATRPRRLDPVGQVLVIAGLASLTYAIIEGPRAGWSSTEIVALFVFSVVCFAALVHYELRRFEPLIEMRFFGSAPFSGASAIAVCLFAAIGGFLFLNTLYLQDVRRLSPLEAGIYMLPMAGVMLVFAPLSGRLVGRRGARPSLVVGAGAVIVASVMLTGLSATTPVAFLLGAYFLFGLGSGLLNPPITNTAVSGMPPSQAGVAAAIASTSRQVGMTLGVAVIGAISGGTISAGIGSFAAATHPGWWVMAGLGLAILILGLVTTTQWANQTASETARRFGRYEPDRVATG